MGQKYCEDHSTLGNCTSRKPEEYVSPTLTLTHTHLLLLSSPFLQCVTTWNSMPRSSLVFKYSTLARLDLNPEHVVYELCYCVETLIRYARPTFFWGSVHKPLNLSWSVIRGKWHSVCKETNGTEHLVKAHLRELYWIGPIMFKMQLEQHAFYIILQSVWVSKISMVCIILYEKSTITAWKVVWIRNSNNYQGRV